MSRVLLVRHGQSAGQLDKQTNISDDQVPLTEMGQKQAQTLADSVTSSPDLIISSPFVRTQETAAPLCAKFPLVPFEIWPVQEFVCLNPNKYVGTTLQQRISWRDEYLNLNDPTYNDGNGAESFSDIIRRATDFLIHIRNLDQKVVYVFTHVLFMKVVETIINSPLLDDNTRMRNFFTEISSHIYKNCQIIEIA
jgi:broad specificity phosphatase PhoE